MSHSTAPPPGEREDEAETDNDAHIAERIRQVDAGAANAAAPSSSSLYVPPTPPIRIDVPAAPAAAAAASSSSSPQRSSQSSEDAATPPRAQPRSARDEMDESQDEPIPALEPQPAATPAAASSNIDPSASQASMAPAQRTSQFFSKLARSNAAAGASVAMLDHYEAFAKGWRCSYCEVEFSDLKTTKNHITLHTGVYQCRRCESRFLSSKALAEHLNTTTGECEKVEHRSTEHSRRMEERGDTVRGHRAVPMPLTHWRPRHPEAEKTAARIAAANALNAPAAAHRSLAAAASSSSSSAPPAAPVTSLPQNGRTDQREDVWICRVSPCTAHVFHSLQGFTRHGLVHTLRWLCSRCHLNCASLKHLNDHRCQIKPEDAKCKSAAAFTCSCTQKKRPASAPAGGEQTQARSKPRKRARKDESEEEENEEAAEDSEEEETTASEGSSSGDEEEDEEHDRRHEQEQASPSQQDAHEEEVEVATPDRTPRRGDPIFSSEEAKQDTSEEEESDDEEEEEAYRPETAHKARTRLRHSRASEEKPSKRRKLPPSRQSTSRIVQQQQEIERAIQREIASSLGESPGRFRRAFEEERNQPAAAAAASSSSSSAAAPKVARSARSALRQPSPTGTFRSPAAAASADASKRVETSQSSSQSSSVIDLTME